jgi:hypothetical protein
MKKRVKKLVLAKETLRSLGEMDLAVPQGANTNFCTATCGALCEGGSGYINCFATQQSSCPC